MGWLILFAVLGIMIYLIVDTSQHKKRLNQQGDIRTQYKELISVLSSIELEPLVKVDLRREITVIEKSYCEISIVIKSTFRYLLDSDKQQKSFHGLINKEWNMDLNSSLKTTNPPRNEDDFIIQENNSERIKIEWKNIFVPQKTLLNMIPEIDPFILKLNWIFSKNSNNLEILRIIINDINVLCKQKEMYLRSSRLMDEKNSELKKINQDYSFSDFFTETEKLSVIRLAWLFAGFNGELYDKAQRPIQIIYQLLNVPFSPDILQKSRSLNSESACANLKNHTEKDWILVSLYSVLTADSKFTKEKEQLLTTYLDWFGVKDLDFHALIKKSNSILNKLNP